jgi:hypothetical protein
MGVGVGNMGIGKGNKGVGVRVGVGVGGIGKGNMRMRMREREGEHGCGWDGDGCERGVKAGVCEGGHRVEIRIPTRLTLPSNLLSQTIQCSPSHKSFLQWQSDHRQLSKRLVTSQSEQWYTVVFHRMSLFGNQHLINCDTISKMTRN